ncbi:MAG TPA: DUF5723 family protein [Longimicrobiales bacterium]|nr:DUF5723 family protein [Longimicrobiales bacterium]
MRTPTLVLALLAATAVPASAQLPQASAAALGLGSTMTASARGFAAVANNPAGLGHPESPGFSMALPGVAAEAGMGPIHLTSLLDHGDQVVPYDVRVDWLAQVAATGGQTGPESAAGTPLALSAGPFGFQISSRAGSRVALNPDAVELLLFGNAGRAGEPRDFDLAGSAIDAYALSTAALSFGFQAAPSLYLGVTGTYTMGHGLVVARDAGSTVTADPVTVQVDLPSLASSWDDMSFPYDGGSGFGMDVGAIWDGPGVTIGATVQNVFNTFEWDLEALDYRPGAALLAMGESSSDFDERPATEAPAELLEEVEKLGIAPVASVGAEMSLGVIRLQADVRKRLADGLELDPDFHAGVGAELTAIGFLPLRAHVAAVSGGVQVGGGASLVLGPVHLSGAGALRTQEHENVVLGMFTLSFGAH